MSDNPKDEKLSQLPPLDLGRQPELNWDALDASQSGEVLPPDANQFGGLTEAEADLDDNMNHLLNAVKVAALRSQIPVLSAFFTHGSRDGQNTGGLALQIAGRGIDSKDIAYTTNIDDENGTVTITPKEEDNFTVVTDDNKPTQVIHPSKANEIKDTLDDDGFVHDETLRTLVDDLAERVNIPSDVIWDFMMQSRSADGQVVGFGFEPDPEDFTAE